MTTSTYHKHVARRANPSRMPPRAKRDAGLRREIQRVFEESLRVYGVRKVAPTAAGGRPCCPLHGGQQTLGAPQGFGCWVAAMPAVTGAVAVLLPEPRDQRRYGHDGDHVRGQDRAGGHPGLKPV